MPFDPLSKYFLDDINKSEASRYVIRCLMSIFIGCPYDVVKWRFVQIECAVPILQ